MLLTQNKRSTIFSYQLRLFRVFSNPKNLIGFMIRSCDIYDCKPTGYTQTYNSSPFETSCHIWSIHWLWPRDNDGLRVIQSQLLSPSFRRLARPVKVKWLRNCIATVNIRFEYFAQVKNPWAFSLIATTTHQVKFSRPTPDSISR